MKGARNPDTELRFYPDRKPAKWRAWKVFTPATLASLAAFLAISFLPIEAETLGDENGNAILDESGNSILTAPERPGPGGVAQLAIRRFVQAHWWAWLPVVMAPLIFAGMDFWEHWSKLYYPVAKKKFEARVT